MSIAAALASGHLEAHWNAGCSMGYALNDMDGEDAEAFTEAMTRPGSGRSRWAVPATTLADVLDAEGIAISSHTINRHRNGRCRCTQKGLTQ